MTQKDDDNNDEASNIDMFDLKENFLMCFMWITIDEPAVLHDWENICFLALQIILFLGKIVEKLSQALVFLALLHEAILLFSM